MERGDAEMAEGRQEGEHAQEDAGLEGALFVQGIEGHGLQIRPGNMVIEKLEHLQRAQTAGAGGAARGQLGGLRGLTQDPCMLLELLPCRQRVGQTIEFVMVRNRQAQQAFQIRTDHDDGGDQIAVFFPLGDVFTGGKEQIHLRDPEFQDEIGQQFPFPQSATQQLQATAPFEAVFFELRRGIVTQDMNAIVAKLYVSPLFSCVNQHRITHSLARTAFSQTRQVRERECRSR